MLDAVSALSGDPALNTTRHGEILVGRLLAPTLERLEAESPLAMQAAQIAAFLPPDAVYEPWLRDLVVKDDASQMSAPHPGAKSPWQVALDALERNLLLRFRRPGTRERRRFQRKRRFLRTRSHRGRRTPLCLHHTTC